MDKHSTKQMEIGKPLLIYVGLSPPSLRKLKKYILYASKCSLNPAENANNQKLMAEYEKYQELQARSQKLQEVNSLKLFYYYSVD